MLSSQPMTPLKCLTTKTVRTACRWSTKGLLVTSSSAAVSANSGGLDLKDNPGVFLPRSQVLNVSGREGHHQNIENLDEAQTKHDKLAECLGIAAEKKYVYDEAAGWFSVKLTCGFMQRQLCLKIHLSKPPLGVGVFESTSRQRQIFIIIIIFENTDIKAHKCKVGMTTTITLGKATKRTQ